MKRRKNLERAIVLGLLLSTSVYGSAWAEISGSIQTFRPSNQDFELKWDYGDDKSGENAIQGISQKNSFDTAISVSSNGEQGFHNVDVELDFDKLEINIGHESNIGSGNNFLSAIMTDGYNKDITADLSINSDGAISITAKSKNNYSVLGVWAKSDDTVTISNDSGDIIINSVKESGDNESYVANTNQEEQTLHAVYGINASKDPVDQVVEKGSAISITSKSGSIKITAKSESDTLKNSHIYAAANDNGNIILNAANEICLEAYANNTNNAYGLDTWGGKENKVESEQINVYAEAVDGDAYGIKVDNGSIENRFEAGKSNIIEANSKNGNAYGVFVNNGSALNIASDENNYINAYVENYDKDSESIAIKADGKGSIVLVSGKETYINSNEDGFYDKSIKGLAVSAEQSAYVDIKAEIGGINNIGGAVSAKDTHTVVNIIGKDSSVENNIHSAAVIEGAGGLEGKKTTIDTETEETVTTGLDVVSALYAENGAQINVSGINNFHTHYSDPEDTHTSERVVWAYDRADINIDGHTNISTTLYEVSPNSKDIAIAAGTATDLNPDKVNAAVTDRATVTLTYDNLNDGNGNEALSYIKGDILSAYEGLVNINAKEGSNAGISIEGNLLAGNNGILSVDLGKGGTLIGRADDYGDAGYVGSIENEGDTNEHQNFYNPAFSSTIYSGGRVDLEMGSGSTWFVTGQSWITSINTKKAQGDTQDTRATIDLTTLYENDEADATTAHALTVYDFNGDADFIMNLDGNRANSDMLYMKKANGTYRINLIDVVTTDEINSDHNGKSFSGLRFATVGNENSDVTFLVGSYDNGGAFNVEYEVGTDEYGGTETAHENDVYNGSSLNSCKPGSDMVDGFFGSDGEPVSRDNNTESGISTMDLQAANNIMLMSEEAATLDETAAAANDAADYNATNHKIIARLGEEISDTGKTILNMSRANYSNAIYMDRLNKRLGEARYINGEEDEGMWVRIRHDRIGKEDAFRSQNTMYELGYDVKQECDNGERRVGFAVDYMHGDTGYTDIAGKGEIDRYGLWLYDTWMGDKGHYVDYVAKWGHLDNDFEVYTMRDGNKVTGDYSNNVFSVSAEYGRKKDIGSDWYFEPQAQLQLARVTGADYTTNQGTKVSVDGINSLIGRAGFRIGKDFGEEKQSTLYFKADVLHEFLGDQDVYVMDKSSDNKWAGISYDNEGTWYDIGIGYAAMMSKSSYAFIDLEQSFGNDNDDTYQINAGVQWTF